MPVLYANNASSTLASAINSSTNLITIGNWAASKFPSITTNSGDFFFATIEEGSTREIVRVTATNSGTSTLTATRGQEGTTAASFTAAAKIEVRATAGLLDALGKTVDIWEQTTAGSYTWRKPTGAKLLHILMFGGGGGGGSGRNRSGATGDAAGGGGGSPGSRVEFWLPASALGATASVSVGGGGSGGVGPAGTQDGNPGNSGGLTHINNVFQAPSGAGGDGGSTSAGFSYASRGDAPTSSMFGIVVDGKSGSGAATNGNPGTRNGLGAGGGGGGGGLLNGQTTFHSGGLGGFGGATIRGDVYGSTTGSRSGPGFNSHTSNWTGGDGGQGGGTAENGYDGGYPGGGGGGGGAASGSAGSGGRGGGGYVRITTFF